MSPRPSFDPGYSTSELTLLFGPERTVAAILEFESALAASLTEVGIAPQDETRAVIEACSHGVGDPDAILESTWETGTPIIGLRDGVTSRLSATQAQWFHFGATSQDAIDTGLMLQAREGLTHIVEDLRNLATDLRELTLEWRDQPQTGRTFLQDADATVFGLRTAGWLDLTVAHLSELAATRGALVIQLGGSVGTLDAYGDHGPAVRNALATRLELGDPGVTWHADRSRILSLAQTLQRTARSMAKIASDVALLASSPIGEMSVRSGGSSSMPDKRNPIDSIRAIAAASACTGAVSMLTAAPPIELDRGVGGWHVEWLAIPLAFQTAGACVEAVATAIASIDVHSAAMGNDVDAPTGSGAQAQIDAVLERAANILSPGFGL